MSQQDVMMQEMMGGMYGPNIYSRYQNSRLPMPGYVGSPNDSQGHPIAAPPGTTINSTPVAPTPAPAAGGNTGWNQNPVGSPLNPTGDWTQLAPQLPGANAQQQANYGYNLGLGGFIDPSTKQASMAGSGGVNSGQSGSMDGAAAAPAQSSMTSALSLLANPAHVSTPGATVPQASPTGQGPSVLASFLANNKAGKGAGNYDNSGFFGTLNALKGS